MPGEWTMSIMGKNGGGPTYTDVPFHSARFTKTLEGPGSFEVNLAVPHIQDYWQAGTHRMTLDGPFDFAGYITGLEQTGRPSDGGIYWAARGLGLAYIFDWRLIRQQITFPNTEQSDIVFAILDHLQDQYNGNMNFSHGTVHDGPTDEVDQEYCFGVVAGDAIREMSTQGTGFDWTVNADGELVIWTGERGTGSGFTLNQDDVSDININFDTSELVTTVSAVGSQTDPFGPIHDMVRDINAADTFGRHEIVIDVNADDDQRPKLLRHARSELKARRGATLEVRATWASGHGPWDYGDVKLGDHVTLDLPTYFGGSQAARCVDISLELDYNAPDNYFLEFGFQARVTDDELDEVDPDA